MLSLAAGRLEGLTAPAHDTRLIHHRRIMGPGRARTPFRSHAVIVLVVILPNEQLDHAARIEIHVVVREHGVRKPPIDVTNIAVVLCCPRTVLVFQIRVWSVNIL